MGLHDIVRYSRLPPERRPAAESYLLPFFQQPVPGSEADEKMTPFREALRRGLRPAVVFEQMVHVGYDALLHAEGCSFDGYLAFQDQGTERHVFRVYVEPEQRGRGIAKALVAAVVKSAHEQRQSLLRLGADRHADMKQLSSHFEQHAPEHRMVYKGEGWFVLG